ncbi:MAG TPA: fumarylacetoacetate hydrolase family protein [Polyangiaceae bacterium]|nr:fumarylacetoacetate hydrolase family protein [Polyangiaceae bacterium]
MPIRYGRFQSVDGHDFFGIIESARVRRLDAAPWLGGRATGEIRQLAEVRALCPVRPTKIVCVGWNYACHAREAGKTAPNEPIFFLKPPSSLAGPGDVVVLPPDSEHVEHEAELGVVIGSRARLVSPERALEHVFGYTCVADVTARDLQRRDGEATRSKGFDTFCPVGPEIVTDLDPRQLRIMCRVAGKLRQDGRTADMLFDVPTLLALASRIMTLEPGDLLATGTPAGVGPLIPGDQLEITVTSLASKQLGIATLSVRAVAASLA